MDKQMFVEKHIDIDTVCRLDRILKSEKNNGNGFWNGSHTKKGFQTYNLCKKEEYKSVFDFLLALPSPELPALQYKWIHMIEYCVGGWQDEHDHSATEEYSFILYLTSCLRGGRTIFIIPGDKSYEIIPEEGKIVFFPANVRHLGDIVIDPKRVVVGALDFIK